MKDLDPEIDLDVVAAQPRRGDYRYAVSNSFGFGGHNVAVVFGSLAGPPWLSLREGELSDLGDAAPEEVSASSQVTQVALIDLVCSSRDCVVATGL